MKKRLISICALGILAMPLAAQQGDELEARRRAEEAAEIAAKRDAAAKAAQAEIDKAQAMQQQAAQQQQAQKVAPANVVAPAKVEPAKAAPVKPGDRKPNSQIIQQANSVKQSMARLPLAGKFKHSDVVRLTRTNPNLSVEIADAAKQPGQNRRIEIEGSTATWVLNCYGVAGRATQTVTLTRYDFDEAERGGFWSTTLNLNANQVNIYSQGGSDDTMEHVQLMITAANVRLIVNEWPVNPQGGIGVRQHKSQNYTAASLFELRTQRPTEYRQKLGPMLRRMLGQDPLAVRAADCYRAFPEIAPDPKVALKVNALLDRFELPMASDRDKASAELAALGVPGVLAALRLDANALTPEQRARIEAFINQHDDKRVVAAAEAAKDLEFLVDALEYDDARVRQAAWTVLKPALNTQVAFDPAAPADKRQGATESLRIEVGKRLAPATQPVEEKPADQADDAPKAQIRPLPARILPLK